MVVTPHHTIFVDSCIGNNKPRDLAGWSMKTDDTFIRCLVAACFSVNDIDYVMCTHMHVDHVPEGALRVWPTGVQLRECGEYENGKSDLYGQCPAGDRGGRGEIVKDNHQIGDHARLLPTPGHTPGHLAFFGKRGDDAVMSGDLMHSPLQERYPELSVNFDVDQAESANTRRSFLERYCDTKTICCTAHFVPQSVARIKRWGEGFKCESVRVAFPQGASASRVVRSPRSRAISDAGELGHKQ
ncbi:MBL fold metallo-hydrolase [Bradyrhizobium shewense]|uniref:MBL fold metallo-hydrolase n=1 Tax=Bradyrhizobium shewense TaxID=1761772 RepID=UPI0024C04FC3|nr:MBL fold metallo-hydrolase [Bradyrhizobium shewense]